MIRKINMAAVEAALKTVVPEGSNTVNVPVTEVTSFSLPRPTLFLKKFILHIRSICQRVSKQRMEVRVRTILL